MAELAPARFAAEASARLKSLELLYDYTKFHIGIYLTLTASYITVATLKINNQLVLQVNFALVSVAIFAFVIAGLAGGIIVSSITQTVGKSSPEFLETKIGPWSWEPLQARTWTYIEHNSFWVGLVFAILSFVDKSVWTGLWLWSHR